MVVDVMIIAQAPTHVLTQMEIVLVVAPAHVLIIVMVIVMIVHQVVIVVADLVVETIVYLLSTMTVQTIADVNITEWTVLAVYMMKEVTIVHNF